MKMFRSSLIAITLAISACERATTAEGCPVMISELGQAHMESCIAAYHAEKARLEGRAVTTCRTIGSTTSCVSE